MWIKRFVAAILVLGFIAIWAFGFGAGPLQLSQNPPSVSVPSAEEPAKPAFIVTDKRRIHILFGDETGGGHRAGAGKKGKTEFPQSWSDDKIIETALRIANDERLPMRPSGRYWLKMDEVEGLKIRVVLNRETGEIITTYPLLPKKDYVR